jgi:Pentapeptide repeats (8 copies)
MMILLLIGGLASLFVAFGGTLLALRIQYLRLSHEQIEREAWEHAQGVQQLNWEKYQKKRMSEIEWSVASQVEQIQEQWMDWEARDKDRTNQLRLEYELLHLPTVEATPLSLQGPEQTFTPPGSWKPPILDRADLRGRDFSNRYLGHAYLRGANLADANFYMTDLRNACLAGANLSGANLTGANLSGADLRGATLEGATLLVADLRNALLHGANLLGARSLTIQQIYMAHYDHTTLLDPEIDLTMPRLPARRAPSTDPGMFREVFEAPLLSSLAADDSQRETREGGFPANAPENSSTGATGTAAPRTKLNGTSHLYRGLKHHSQKGR